MNFADLQLSTPILPPVASEGYSIATPVQAEAIPHALRSRDILGCAQTGTGKTAAFALPILHRLSTIARPAGAVARARALILCPTRELASQIAESFRVYGKHVGIRQTIIFGGVKQRPQVDSMRRGTDVIVATPGRLLDLLDQGHVDLRGIEVLVLDEADRMLDMGFIHDIRKIVAKLPPARQTMLFSATIPTEIRRLADSLLRNPVSIQVAPASATADGVDQSVYFVDKRNKAALLAHLVDNLPMSRAIVFTRTKRGADRVVVHLHSSGIRAEAIHGNKSQNARERALANFRASKIPVLVATDIASRGIDVDGITHVVNFDLTDEPETYVHRIGRTARAGATGAAVSLCGPDEVSNLKAIEKLIRRTIPVKTDQPRYASHAPAAHEPSRQARPRHVEPRRASHAPRQAQANKPYHSQPYASHPQTVKPHPAKPVRNSGEAMHSAVSTRPGSPRSNSPRPRHPLHGASSHAHAVNARPRHAGRGRHI